MIGRVAGKIREAVRSRGVLGAARHYAGRAVGLAQSLMPANRRWVRSLRERDRQYDEHCGVDTAGLISPNALGVEAETRRFAVAYIASVPEEFRRTLDSVPIDHHDFVFIDIGSGKGRAVLMAMAYPFKKVVGVEFSPVLHEVALRNIAAFRGERRCADAELICADAVTYSPPDDPLACYLYNPFQREIMEAVLANLRASFERCPRPIYIFYCNPVHQDVLCQASFLEKVAGGELFAVYRARLAGQPTVPAGGLA